MYSYEGAYAKKIEEEFAEPIVKYITPLLW